MPDLKNFNPAGPDSVRQQVVSVQDQFPIVRASCTAHVRVLAQMLSTGAKLNQQGCGSKRAVLRYMIENALQISQGPA